MSEETRRRVAEAMTALVHPIPVNMRMYLNNFREHPTPLKNEDLWESDRDAIRHAIEASRKRDARIPHPLDRRMPPGTFGYGDYSDEEFIVESPSENVASVIYQSLVNPAYRMETTLGRAKFRQDPSGQIEVDDAYDFASPRAHTELMKKEPYGVLGGMANALIEHGPLGVGNVIGNILRSQGEGTPFTFTIPPKVGRDTHPREIAQTEPTNIPLEIRMAQRPQGPSQRTYPEMVAEIRGVPLSQEDIGYAILEREQLAAKEQAARERELYKQRPQYGTR